MKIPLQYQRTEYDCGPTTLMNAISYLFQREDIPPELIQHIMMYSLDSYNSEGEQGKNGTSYMAMMFLSCWLNHYSTVKNFPINTQYLSGRAVGAEPESKIVSALQQGGVVVARVIYDVWHYVLITGYAYDPVTLWDPYFQVEPIEIDGCKIEILTDSPYEKNRQILTELLNRTDNGPYAFGPIDEREAVIVFNRNTKQTPEKTIEYFI